jgi:hypothetical protein
MNTRRFTWSRLPPPRCRGSSGESERDIVFTRQFRIIKPRTTRPCAARWKRNLWNLRNRGIRVDGARNVAKLHAYLLHHLRLDGPVRAPHLQIGCEVREIADQILHLRYRIPRLPPRVRVEGSQTRASLELVLEELAAGRRTA